MPWMVYERHPIRTRGLNPYTGSNWMREAAHMRLISLFKFTSSIYHFLNNVYRYIGDLSNRLRIQILDINLKYRYSGIP